MNGRRVLAFRAVAWAALLWALGNTFYVYLFLGGTRPFRVESAVFLLVAALLPLVWCGPSRVRSPAVMGERASRLFALVAAGFWLLALVPFVTLPFLSDDYVFVASLRTLSDAVTKGPFFRPMFAAVFLVLARVGGDVPLPFHVAGLLIHATSAAFVYVLAQRFFQRRDVAAFAFAVFLLNPLQAEAVLWVSGLQDLLWTGFMLAALVVYTGSQVLTVTRLCVTVLLVIFSLLSKETAVSFVLLLPLTDWAFFSMKRGPLLPIAYSGFVLTLAAYLCVRSRVAPIDSAFYTTPTRYFVQKFLSTPYKFFAQPWNIKVVHVSPAVPCCLTVVLLIACFWAVNRGAGRSTLLGPAVVLASTLPVYAYFHVAADLRATRYLYFASVGWALLTAQTVKSLPVRRVSFAAVFASSVVVSYLFLQVNLRPWRTAGEIVDAVCSAIVSGKSVEARSAELRKRYGDGLEVSDGVPVAYKGVYLFVNGYPQLRRMLTADGAR
jgi:hypothetical protein